jgi:hypothetical protein
VQHIAPGQELAVDSAHQNRDGGVAVRYMEH